jgi:N-methylhydantoinase A/oxoprolinase/acetone carboxylase beta subunit
MAHRVGVDVGGTFTDLLLVNDETGDLYRVKTPSTPAEPSEGVLVGVKRISEESGVAPSDLDFVMHGMTVATNAMLPREAVGDRDLAAHEANLHDLDAKYADVVSVDEVLCRLEELAGAVARP